MSNQLLEALKNKASSQRVEELIHLYPEAVKVHDSDGNFPLHRALFFNCSSNIIKILLEAYPKALQVKNNRGELLLHYALYLDASSDVIMMLFKAYPKAVEIQDMKGYLPLHTALRWRVSSDHINMIFNEYPEAVQVQDNYGWLPLHHALQYNSSSDVVKMLFQAHPQAAEVQNNDFRNPLHYACFSKASLRESFLEVLNLLISVYPEGMDAEDRDGMLPSYYLQIERANSNCNTYLYLLHEAVKAGFSKYLVKLLLQAFPESCTTKDNDGMVPLHHACTSSAVNHLEIVVTLLGAVKDFLDITDNHGRTPMQLLKLMASHQDGHNMFPLHHLAASSDCLTERSLLLLFNAYPESIRSPDKYRMLPFHHACLNQAVSLDILMHILNLFPTAVTGVGLNVNDETNAYRPSKRKK
jgi:ankyrin repeat protein